MLNRPTRTPFSALLIFVSLVLTGCQSTYIANYTPSFRSKTNIRVALSPFTLTIGNIQSKLNIQQSMPCRLNNQLIFAQQLTLSEYLRDALIETLTASDRYAHNASHRLNLDILEFKFNSTVPASWTIILRAHLSTQASSAFTIGKKIPFTTSWNDSDACLNASMALQGNLNGIIEQLLTHPNLQKSLQNAHTKQANATIQAVKNLPDTQSPSLPTPSKPNPPALQQIKKVARSTSDQPLVSKRAAHHADTQRTQKSTSSASAAPSPLKRKPIRTQKTTLSQGKKAKKL